MSNATKKINQNNIRMSVMSRLLASAYKSGIAIKGSSAIGCQRWKKHTSENQSEAEIAISSKNGSYESHMHDHFVCNNYKFCPHCARRGAAEMREYITDVLVPAVAANGYALAMMTLTASHFRESDWQEFTDNFFKAVTLFNRRMHKAYKAIGCPGQLRSMENPVGENGLHLHHHDELPYIFGADLVAFEKKARKKWREALKEVGLHCNSHGLNFTIDFDPTYVAKDETINKKESKETAFELAAYDTKSDNKNKTLFQLLDACSKGNEEAGKDWIRAVTALQGRSRWNIGQLAKKLGIPSPSEWRNRANKGIATATTPKPAILVAYPIEDHLIATTPDNPRPAMALILRAARQEPTNPGSVLKMVNALSNEVVNNKIFFIRKKFAKKIATKLDALWSEPIHESLKIIYRNNILATEFKYMQVAILEYEEHNKLLNPVYANAQRAMWFPAPITQVAPVASSFFPLPNMKPNTELEFL